MRSSHRIVPQLLICSGCVITFTKVFMCIILQSIILYSILLLLLLLLLLLSRFSRVQLCDPIDGSPSDSWDSPGKTGVGCHFLLQHMKVKSESKVIQLCLTLCNPMDCSLPGSTIHGILQARVLEWGALAFLSYTQSDQIRSAVQSYPTLCDPMNLSTPGLPVPHQLPEFTQTHVHRVSDVIQPSHPLSSPSPPAPNPSQHQSLFQ